MSKAAALLKLFFFSLGLPALVGCSSELSSVATSSQVFKERRADEVWKLPGLRGRVEVARDVYGIPHLYAENRHDLMLVQGYQVARDRFWEMDVFRRAGTGRLSTLVGLLPVVTDFDELFRAINLTERGTMAYDEIYDAMREDDRELLDAYTAGVNLYLSHAATGRYGATVPPEYHELVLGMLFQPTVFDIPAWASQDIIAIGRFQQWLLSGSTYEDELVLGRLYDVSVTRPALWNALARFQPAVTVATLDDWPYLSSSAGSAPVLPELAPASERDLRPALRKLDRMREALPLLMWPDNGSNNWVIGGSRSESGNVLLANDPHLVLTNPPLFYQAHLNTKKLGESDKDGWNAYGVVFPGIPVFMIAHTERIAWGVTVLGYDVADVYEETLTPDGAAVLRGDTTIPIKYSEQRYCHGYSDQCIDRPLPWVPGHGPRIEEDGAYLTLRWTGMEPTQDFRAFIDLMTADNVSEAMDAVAGFKVGAQSFVIGDVEGNIGYFGSANVPVRDPRCPRPPYVPLDGASGLCEWQGYLPREQLVQAYNPARGYVATANNDIVGSTFDNTTWGTDEPYYWHTRDAGFRIGRITELIEEKEKLNKADMERIAADTLSVEGSLLAPRLVDVAQEAPELITEDMAEALRRLDGWKYGTPTGLPDPISGELPSADAVEESIAASIYYTWIRMLGARFTDDEFAAVGITRGFESDGYDAMGIVRVALYAFDNTEAAFLWDDIRTPDHEETRAEVMLGALADALTWLTERFETDDQSAWTWGTLHYVRFFDPYGLLGANLRSIGPYPNDGGIGTVDAANYLFLNDSYVQVSGPQMRMVTELDPAGVKSFNSLPGGQIHDRFSPHYDDLVPYWMQNRTYAVPFADDDVREAMETLTIALPAVD